MLPFAPSAAAAAAPDTDATFLAEPAAGSTTDPKGGYFLVATAPGQVVTQSVGLRNDSDHPLDLRLAGVDAATAQRGGSSFALDTDTPAKAGAWLALDQTAVTLGAGASLTVPVRITVPADAISGVHLAGIAVMSPTPAIAGEGATAKAG